MKNIKFRAMGTDIEFIIGNSGCVTMESTLQAVQHARNRMALLESLLSRFRDDSEVNRMNTAKGEPVKVSGDTIRILLIAVDAFTRTHGFFNPFIGQVLENLGYNVTFEKIGQVGPTVHVSTPFVAPVRSPLSIDKDAFLVQLDPGYRIDLGGIAKGWIVEETAQVLLEAGITNFICNAGGDLVCRGIHDCAPWTVGITDPFDELNTVVNLDVHNLCVATSGTYRRRWSMGNKVMHHIIDPFLGQPVDSDTVSCTVVHHSLVEAEILAKVSLILGTAKGIPWLKKQDPNKWIMVTNTGEVKTSWI
jgi:FAD:protein FMN transferase